MGILANEQHERFAQEFHSRRLQQIPPRQARDEAYVAAGYKSGPKTLSDNARRLSHHPDVKARLEELRTRSAQLAELDAGWCLLALKQRVERARF